jgi:hypothetical protein
MGGTKILMFLRVVSYSPIPRFRRRSLIRTDAARRRERAAPARVGRGSEFASTTLEGHPPWLVRSVNGAWFFGSPRRVPVVGWEL